MLLNKKIIFTTLMLLASKLLFSQSDIFEQNKFLQQLEVSKYRIIDDSQHRILVQLTQAEYFTRQQKDSLLYIFLDIENAILEQYDLQLKTLAGNEIGILKKHSNKNKAVTDSLEQVIEKRKQALANFQQDFAIFNPMRETLENTKTYRQLKTRLNLFPYIINSDYYFKKAINLHQSGKPNEAGRIFYQLLFNPDTIMQKQAAKRLADVEASMYAREKEHLLGTWDHFDRKYTCWGQIGNNPSKMQRIVTLDNAKISIFEKDSCVLQSACTIQPAFDWRIGTIGFKLHIAKTNEIWGLSISNNSRQPLSLWVTYPPPVPYTSSQPYDVYEKINTPVLPTVTVRN